MSDKLPIGWAALQDDCACGNPNPAQASARELAAEIERLKAERNGAITSAANAEADAVAARRSLRAALVERDQTFKTMHDRATAAEAERDRLREVVMWFVQYAEGAPIHRGEADEMLAKARAALASGEGEKP